jgi:hypothetical protein
MLMRLRRTDLGPAACTNLLDRQVADARDHVRNLMANWQADPDLAGLREPTAMKTFPTAERRECLALWQDVNNLLRRAR